MFSEITEKSVHNAIIAETENAKKTYGEKYNSLHEGYAVLKEEVEEAFEDAKAIQERLDELWHGVRSDNGPEPMLLDVITFNATELAKEAVQVAAVCNKLKESL